MSHLSAWLPETVSLVLSVLSEDVCVAFSFEASILQGGGKLGAMLRGFG